MKYLIWSTIDLERGMGGVETHARSVARELSQMGVEVTFSQDPLAPWSGSFDVLHTHGSQFPGARAYWNSSELPKNLVWLHTLHGWTHERIAACWEYFWPRAYTAIFNEYVGAKKCDHLFVVHNQLSFLQKVTHYSVCGNGWDSWEMGVESVDGGEDFEGRWLFIGRGSDPVKGVDRLLAYTDKIKITAIPGEGFEADDFVIRAGKKSPNQIKRALMRSQGLILTSLYEGLPLVVLEALALGCPVVTTKVGGLKSLPSELQGIRYCQDDLSDIVQCTQELQALDTPGSRDSRALHNRKFLKTWMDVAKHILAKANEIRAAKGLSHVH